MPQSAADAPTFGGAIPIIRIFDVDRAKAFYVDHLAFVIEWEHRFGDDFPLYAQISRGGLTLHLSEHAGDATPGATVFIWITGLDALHAELTAKGSKAHIDDGPGDFRVLQVWDPFSNRVRFAERNPPRDGPAPA